MCFVKSIPCIVKQRKPTTLLPILPQNAVCGILTAAQDVTLCIMEEENCCVVSLSVGRTHNRSFVRMAQNIGQTSNTFIRPVTVWRVGSGAERCAFGANVRHHKFFVRSLDFETIDVSGIG